MFCIDFDWFPYVAIDVRRRQQAFIDLHGFPSISLIWAHKVWEPVTASRVELGPPIERWQTPSLQAWRLGGLDGWTQEALKAGGSDPGALEAGWLACWLGGLDWIGLDASGCWIGVGGGNG